ncbi:MAG TPA: hypothetical protein VFP22_11275 [Candidatus Limnocylindrales bacterium]|nr:hypothetical protein [Candidatus Limnocylindrales bacterium]
MTAGTGDDGGWEAFDAEPATSDLTLEEVLRSAADGLDDVVATDSAAEGVDPAATSWSVRGRPVAILAGGRAEFRLDPLVARAALRTPDTTSSTRGPDWVAFAPVALDDAAVDRAEAWFLSAVRRAEAAGNR